jgi:acetylornithine deacetylase/succinyl-diaminopimelate desuccinylase-like protein
MSLGDDVVKNIDRNELNELALSICNIDSAGPTEAAVAERVFEWLKKEGFKARKLGLLADRFNVMGLLPGSGGGYSLLFNTHMDTAVRKLAGSSPNWRGQVLDLVFLNSS